MTRRDRSSAAIGFAFIAALVGILGLLDLTIYAAGTFAALAVVHAVAASKTPETQAAPKAANDDREEWQ